MAGLIDVAVLPRSVHTVDEALELLLTLPSHAFVLVRGEPTVVHASDLLAARREDITDIGDVRGRRLGRIPETRPAQRVFLTGKADEIFGPLFRQSGVDYLLGDIDGNTATVLTRSKRFEYDLSQAACECDVAPGHVRDGQRSDTGKGCAVPGCPGTNTCY